MRRNNIEETINDEKTIGAIPMNGFKKGKTRCAEMVPYAAVIGIVSVLFGCSATPSDEPDRTTYPRDSVREEHMSMSLGGARSGLNVIANDTSTKDTFTYRRTTEAESEIEWDDTIVGDSAEHEVHVVPKAGQNMSEMALRRDIPQLGKKLCGEHYHLTMAKYYLGTEATSAMRGLNHPWLLANIRCPVQIDARKEPLSAIISLASFDIPDAEYFDIHEMDFTRDKDELLVLLRRVVMARGWTATEKTVQGNVCLVTNRYRAGMPGAPTYEQLVSIVAPRPSGSTLAFRLVLHNRDFEGTSDATGPIRLTPMRRDSAYREATKLLGELNASPNG